MAVGTATAIMGGLSLGNSIYQTIQGSKDAKKAKNALNNYDRQELTNVYENIPISTIGSNLIREENARTAATGIEASRSGGIRGVVGSTPRIQAATNDANREAQVYLDDQVNKRNYSIANDEQRIQSMQEARENADLAGLGQQYEVGRQNTFSGIRGITNSLMSVASNINSNTSQQDNTPQVSSVDTVSASGVQLPQQDLYGSYVNTVPTVNQGLYDINKNYGF